MKSTNLLHTPLRGFKRALFFILIGSVGFGLGCNSYAGSKDPINVGAGLNQVVKRDLAAKAAAAGQGGVVPDAAGTGSAVDVGDRAIRDEQDRILVTIFLKSPADRESVLKVRDLRVVAEDMKYQGGAMDAYVAPEQVATLARRVAAVHLAIAPVMDVGLTTSHGVVQHRVDQISNQSVTPVTGLTGNGITVGVMSDSFAAPMPAKTTTPAQDVASGDLPGPGNLNNPTPTLVLSGEDLASGSDEGRAMCQIIHDMAPKANLAFATAFGGEVSFANNIRRLAAPVTGDPDTSGAGCQVIVDDVINFAEGMFQDTIVARAVDEVAAQGVSYFSSAGNRPATQAYFSDFRAIFSSGGNTAADNVALTNTNLNLAGVPAALYAGGFHDFNPAGGAAGLDVAQTCAIGNTAIFDLQWDDPYNVNPIVTDAPFVSGTGTVAPGGSFDFMFNGTTDQRVQIRVFGSGATPDFDAIVEVINPDGSTLADQDTGLEETLNLTLPQTGIYTVRVTQFGTQTGGQFDYSVANILSGGETLVTTDFNLLYFRTDGSFIAAVGENNIGSNRPVEISQVTNTQAGGTGQVQIVIARSNVPPANPQPASKLRYITFNSGEPIEYFSFQTRATFGHNSAAGAMGVAAYAFYPPFIPETFTSPGIGFFAFDQNNNRLFQPQLRLKPDMAAMDGANNTFFSADAGQDADTFPNFFGTSAAAPHAAAIGALVLEAKGGPGSVTPAQMRTILQRSAFPHDLDPYLARAIARSGASRLTITTESNASNRGSNDNNIFQVAFSGPNSLTQVVFNPQGTPATGGNTTEPTVTSGGTGTSSPGIAFDSRPVAPGFPFTLGTLRGVAASDLNAVQANPVPVPPAASPNQTFTLAVNINFGALVGGDGFNFGIERDEVDAFGPGGSVGGDSADLLGANVSIPSGLVAPGGMTIGGTISNGGNLSAVFVNRIGAGFSALDGFGFINAQNAVNQPLP